MARPQHNLETPAEPPTTCGATLGGRYPLLPYIIRGKKGSVDSMYLCSCLLDLNLVTWTATRYMWQSLCKIWGPNHHIFMLLFLAVKDNDKDKNKESDLVIQWLSDTVDCSWQIEILELWHWGFVTDCNSRDVYLSDTSMIEDCMFLVSWLTTLISAFFIEH